MKRCLCTLLLFSISVASSAQENKISLAIVGGPVFASSDFRNMQNGGMGLSVSALYNISNQFSAGIEGNLSRFQPYWDYSNKKTKIDGVLLKGLYNFNTKSLRPYWGAMVGLYYNTIYVPVNYDGDQVEREIFKTMLGGGVLFGVNYKKINCDIAYYNLGKLNANIPIPPLFHKLNSNISFFQIRVGVNLTFNKKKE